MLNTVSVHQIDVGWLPNNFIALLQANRPLIRDKNSQSEENTNSIETKATLTPWAEHINFNEVVANNEQGEPAASYRIMYRLKFKTSGKLLIVLEEFIEYTTI